MNNAFVAHEVIIYEYVPCPNSILFFKNTRNSHGILLLYSNTLISVVLTFEDNTFYIFDDAQITTLSSIN